MVLAAGDRGRQVFQPQLFEARQEAGVGLTPEGAVDDLLRRFGAGAGDQGQHQARHVRVVDQLDGAPGGDVGRGSGHLRTTGFQPPSTHSGFE